ncbi:MAG: putative metal-binding motif-containing protein [Alphaproteobacteria bacterium]|nr:putative metal-binding motif-containing protein [Alphaproteobacteria bacterium]
MMGRRAAASLLIAWVAGACSAEGPDDAACAGADCADDRADPADPGSLGTPDGRDPLDLSLDLPSWGVVTPGQGRPATVLDLDADGSPVPEDCDDEDPLTYPGAAPLDSVTACLRDADGDGWGDADALAPVEAGTDCDDADAGIAPDAEERCNGVDDDCDGLLDDADPDVLAIDLVASTRDLDADGWGGPDLPRMSCTVPAGSSAQPGDCDDLDPWTHPGAAPLDDATACLRDRDGDGRGDAVVDEEASVEAGTDCDDGHVAISPDAEERCNGVDDDCDALVDAEDDSVRASDLRAAFADLDGDGFGDPLAPRAVCAVGEGSSGLPLDCDDSDAAVHPLAPEVCNGQDDDCDDLVDLDDAMEAEDVVFAWQDEDDDGFGVPGPSTRLCALTDGWADRTGDCADDDPARNPGAIDALGDGVDADCNGVDGMDPPGVCMDPADGVLWDPGEPRDTWVGADGVLTTARALDFASTSPRYPLRVTRWSADGTVRTSVDLAVSDGSRLLDWDVLPDGDVLLLGPGTGSEGTVARFSPQGELRWAVGLTPGNWRPLAVVAMPDGGAVVPVGFVQPSGFVRLGPDGAVLWARTLPSGVLRDIEVVVGLVNGRVVALHDDELAVLAADGQTVHAFELVPPPGSVGTGPRPRDLVAMPDGGFTVISSGYDPDEGTTTAVLTRVDGSLQPVWTGVVTDTSHLGADTIALAPAACGQGVIEGFGCAAEGVRCAKTDRICTCTPTGTVCDTGAARPRLAAGMVLELGTEAGLGAVALVDLDGVALGTRIPAAPTGHPDHDPLARRPVLRTGPAGRLAVSAEASPGPVSNLRGAFTLVFGDDAATPTCGPTEAQEVELLDDPHVAVATIFPTATTALAVTTIVPDVHVRRVLDEDLVLTPLCGGGGCTP